MANHSIERGSGRNKNPVFPKQKKARAWTPAPTLAIQAERS